jgi:hypothetical protein
MLINFLIVFSFRITNIFQLLKIIMIVPYFKHIYSTLGWCTANHMKIDVIKTNVVSFTRKPNMISFEYKLCGQNKNRSDTIKGSGISFVTNLYFHKLSSCWVWFVYIFFIFVYTNLNMLLLRGILEFLLKQQTWERSVETYISVL